MSCVEEPEVQLAQRLASNEKTVRSKAVKTLRRYISARSHAHEGGFTGDELLKLWKGLFYCLWMQDKPLLQENLSTQISSLIHSFHHFGTQLLYVESFLQTFKREWTGIDRLRMDKFYQLIRFMFRQTFEALKRKNWDAGAAARFLELLSAQLLQSSSEAPSGLQLHILDLYMTELAAVGSAQLTADQNLMFIEPFCKTAAKTKDRALFGAICTSIFSAIIDQAPFAIEDLMREVKTAETLKSNSGQASEDNHNHQEEELPSEEDGREGAQKNIKGKKATEEQDESELHHLEQLDSDLPEDTGIGPVLQFDYATVADKLFELASRSSTPASNRQRLYKIIKVLRNLSEGIFPQDEYPEDVSTDEDDDMFGSRKRMKRRRHHIKDKEGPPAAKKNKEEKSDKSNEQKLKSEPTDGAASVEKKKKKKRRKTEESGGEQEKQQRMVEDTNGCPQGSQTQSCFPEVKTKSSNTDRASQPEPCISQSEPEAEPPSQDVSCEAPGPVSEKKRKRLLAEDNAELTSEVSQISTEKTIAASPETKEEKNTGLGPEAHAGASLVCSQEEKTTGDGAEADVTTATKKKDEVKTQKTEANVETSPREENAETAFGMDESTSAKKKKKKFGVKSETENTETDTEEPLVSKQPDESARYKPESDATTYSTQKEEVITERIEANVKASSREDTMGTVSDAKTPAKKKKKKKKIPCVKPEEETEESFLNIQDEENTVKTREMGGTNHAKKKGALGAEEELEGDVQVNGVSPETGCEDPSQLPDTTTLARRKGKKKSLKAHEEEKAVVSEALQINATEQPVKTRRKKAQLGMRTGQAPEGEGEKSGMPLKKKSKPRVDQSSADELYEDSMTTLPKKISIEDPELASRCRKGAIMKRKIPVLIEFEAEELGAAESNTTKLSTKSQTPKSESKKVTFGLKNNKTAEFRKTDRSLLVSPDGSSRVPFDPQQKPKCGVLKSPLTPLSSRKKTPNSSRSWLKPRATAADFF